MEQKGKVIEDCFMTWVKILEMSEKERGEKEEKSS